jgi:hypothetical protein
MKAARQLSIAILFVLCITAFYAGYHMVSDPTGSSLGLPFYLLNGSVFTSYAMIGWLLLFMVGVFSVVTIICIKLKSSIYSFLIMLQGVILFVFIVIQMLLLGETFIIQYAFLIAGIALIGLGALQFQRKIVIESKQKTDMPVKSHHHKHRK